MAFVNFTSVHEKLFVILRFNIRISEGDPCNGHILTFAIISNFLLLCLTLLGYSIVNISNIENATNTMSILFGSISCIVKILLFYIHRKKIVNVIWKLRSISNKDNSTEERILEVENRKVVFVTKLFVYLISSTFVVFITIPLGKMAFLFWKFGKVSYFLPFNGLYPFDWEKPFVFSLTFLWVSSTMLYAAIFIASIDTLFIAVSFNLCAQFQILNRKTELLKIDGTQDLEKEIGKIISHHQLILELIKELNEVFRPILFVQFLMSAMQLCTISFQIVVFYNDPQVILYGCYLTASLLQLLMYCYCGDRIQSESEAFGTHIYLGYWYTFPPKIARCLYFSLMRSQRPSKLDGHFFEVNLITFNSILTSTYSYITFLLSLLEERSD